jgi:hypothetical protein
MQIKDIIYNTIKEFLNEEVNHFQLNEIIKTIPVEIINATDEFKNGHKMIIFSLIECPEIKIYIYDDLMSKFPTSSINNPKHIYININHLSDIPEVILGNIGKNLYVNVYYAILHELSHILNKHNSYGFDHTDPKNYDKYINSHQEKKAMEDADLWLNSFINK